ncbi:MAG: glycosyltransferase family 2 protein [Bacteroidota bacterium]
MGNNDPLVSVVLPFLNAQFTLSRSVASILNQSYRHFELILVDNGSTDSGALMARGFAKKDARVTLLTENQKGVVFAANEGIRHAKGKYIARMDADDFSHPDRLKQQVQFLENHPDTEVVSGIISYGGSEVNGGFVRYIDWLNSIKTREDISLNQFVEYPLANPSLMMKRELFQTYGNYRSGSFPEDYEFFLRLQANGVKMGKVSQVVLEWSDLPNRLTRTHSSYTNEAFYLIKAAYLAKWLKKRHSRIPNVFVWGAGKESKKRSRLLHRFGIDISGYIDIKKSADTVFYQDIGAPNDLFILSYVANWGAREEIRTFLNKRDFVEGTHYLICA